jgi:zinc transport system permease protein
LFDPTLFSILKNSLLEVILVCLLAGVMGIFVVNFQMAFFSDAISHSAFTGVALGLIAGVDPLLTVVAFGVIIGLFVVYFRKKTGMSYDTIIGVFFSFSVSLGIVIVSSSKGLFRNFHSFLYGDILLINSHDLVITLLLLIVTSLFIIINFDKLTLIGIDEAYAATHVKGITILKYAFALLLGLVVTLSIKTVGILLVTALLVVPAASARAISNSITWMFFNSIILSVLSGIGGIFLSFHLNSSAGASIVIVSCLFFLLGSLWKNLQNYRSTR